MTLRLCCEVFFYESGEILCAFPYKFLGIYNLYRQMPLRAWSCVQAVGQNAEMGIIASNLYIQNEYNVVFMYKLFLRHRPSEPFN